MHALTPDLSSCRKCFLPLDFMSRFSVASVASVVKKEKRPLTIETAVFAAKVALLPVRQSPQTPCSDPR
jgi:hypothetical protein